MVMEEGKKLKQMLLVTGSFGFVIATMVVITEIVRLTTQS